MHPVVRRDAFKSRFPRRFEQMSAPKIIISGMRHFEAFFDATGDWIAGKSTVVLRDFRKENPPEVVLALLNSRVTRFFLKECYGSLAMDGGITFTPKNVRRIPVPRFGKTDKDGIGRLVKAILAAASCRRADEMNVLMEKIDDAIYSAFRLSVTEVEIIKDRTGRKGRRQSRTD
jgi:hypothetical protein